MIPEDDLYMLTRAQLISGARKVLLVGFVLGAIVGTIIGGI